MERALIIPILTVPKLSVLFALTTLCAAAPSAIILDVSRSFDPYGRSGGLVINCSIDAARAGIDKLASLTVFGSRPYGAESDLDQLASVNIWSKSPQLAADLEEADVSVDSSLSSDSAIAPRLTLAWRSGAASTGRVYRCVANGIDRDGQAASVSTNVQVGAIDTGCCQKMDRIEAGLVGLTNSVDGTQNLTEGVASQMLTLDNRFADVEATCAAHFQSLSKSFQRLEEKFDDVDGVVSSTATTLATKVGEMYEKLIALEQNMNLQIRLVGVDKTRFDVSSAHRGRLYLVSKAAEPFNIATANHYCRLSGGYLVELDDSQEYQFVLDLASAIGGANTFWTGANDIDNEGTFVFYNSKKPVAELAWSGGQPDNAGGFEDCVEIRLDFGGLNDWICDQSGKFVCEVPI